MEKENYFAENLKFLIWKANRRATPSVYRAYIRTMASESKIPFPRLVELLAGSTEPRPAEIRKLQRYFGKSEIDFPSQDVSLVSLLPDREWRELLNRSIQYQLTYLSDEDTECFAVAIGANAPTILNWKAGKRKPGRSLHGPIARYFGFSDEDALARSFCFMELNLHDTNKEENQLFETHYDALKLILEGRK